MSNRYARLLWFGFFATLIAVAVLLLPGAATPVNADGTLKYCGSIPEDSFPFPDQTKVTLNKFNLSGDTLTSVTVTATEWITQSYSAENRDDVAGYVKGNTNANLEVYGPNNPFSGGTPLFTDTGSQSIISSTLQATDGVPGSGPDYKLWPTVYYNATGSKADATTGYVGAGTVDFPTHGYAQFLNTGDLGNLTTILTTTARVDICVIYTYTGPTAVTVSSFSADTNSTNPTVWVVTGLLAIGMLSAAGWKLTH